VPQEETTDDRLNRRAWLIYNMDYVLEEAVYHRAHKEEFALPTWSLWNWDDESGSCKIEYVE